MIRRASHSRNQVRTLAGVGCGLRCVAGWCRRRPTPAPAPEPLPEPLIVREYAHVHSHGESAVRQDFQEPVCWKPAVVLADGHGEVSFDLADSVTTFEVRAAGHTLDGRIGQLEHLLIGRAEAVTQQLEVRSRAAGETLRRREWAKRYE